MADPVCEACLGELRIEVYISRIPRPPGVLTHVSVFMSLIDPAQFVLALGNRPKGERGLYTTTLVVYALLAIYLIIASWVLTIQALIVRRELYQS